MMINSARNDTASLRASSIATKSDELAPTALMDSTI